MSEKEVENQQPPRHAPPKGTSSQRQELLYDPNVPTSSHAEQARTMAEKMSTATLCTMSADYSGHPYGSFVTYALHNGNPIFLISALAEHTKNLTLDSKASLLIAEGGDGNPLALGRITLIGNCTKVPDSERSEMKEIFLSKHESAKFYVDFGDFYFFRLMVDSVRYIGGFGRMSWVDEDSWSLALPDPLQEHADGIIEHMNEDHDDAMLVMCQKMSMAVDTSEAVMTGIDRYGFEMSALTSDGPRPIRLGFDNEATTPDEARIEIVALVKKARAME